MAPLPEDEQEKLRTWIREVAKREGDFTRAAKALGVSQPHISYTVSRRNAVGPKVERALAAYFKLPIETLRSTAPTSMAGKPAPVSLAGPGASTMSHLVEAARQVQRMLQEDLHCTPDTASAAIGRALLADDGRLESPFDLYRAANRFIALGKNEP